MGTDAEVFIFDHDAYLTAVVPAFFELLGGGKIADWLEPFARRRELKPWLWPRSDLDRYRAALNSDLSCGHSPYDLRWTYGKDWQEQWSRGTEASVNSDIPSADTIEQINWLFKIAVSIKCLGGSQFVGRSQTVNLYAEILSELGVRDDDRIVELLAALGKRGFLIGYQFGSGCEGVNGWLDATETAELAERLDALSLPRYEVSFAAMEQFRRPDMGGYECEGFSFEALSLSFVRTIATIAAQESHGVLWGNGVMPPDFYLSGQFSR
jgi:hypothetical protein